ncbi:hypothetical protein GEO21_11480 [Sphingobacterium faecium]|uniref:FixH family protein n=1 Tax=Sphingobacterium faecium TaxID=34087 RepID=UPI000FAD7367|nr:FixH family protein [Sphingobacterium faecium]MQP28127.1 hypothetical protein [Sphingobacterium faecium]
MNWGNKIFLSLGVFMLCIVSAGIYMVSHDTDTLEDTDYYEQGLNYDQVYNKKENVVTYQAKPIVKISQDTLYIEFVHVANKGNLIFKRPSDSSIDLQLPFETNSTLYQLPISSLKKGTWNLEIIWKSGGLDFLTDQQLHL